MSTVTYTVPKIHCAHCVHTIQMELGDLEGVQNVNADMNTKQVEVTFDAPASTDKIESLLTEINYPAQI
jgi:copper chaperone CopZ